MKIISQRHYPKLEIDTREKEIVQIHMNGKEDFNTIQVERKNLQKLINILKKEIKPPCCRGNIDGSAIFEICEKCLKKNTNKLA